MKLYIPQELIDEFASGNGAIWLGAGCSKGSGLPTWDDLVKNMSQKLLNESKEYKSLEWSRLTNTEIAQLFKNKFGSHYYYKFLRNQLVNKNADTVSDVENTTLNAVAELTNYFWPKPGIDVFTTNYDHLLEDLMLMNHGKNVRRIVSIDDLATINSKEELTLIKPNGDIDYPDSITLTLEDYLQFRSKKKEIVTYLKDKFANKTFLFIGYGLDDFIFNTLIGELQTELGEFKRKMYIISQESSFKRELLKTLDVELISIQDFNEIPYILRAIVSQQTDVDYLVKNFDELNPMIKKFISEKKFLFVDDEQMNCIYLREIFKQFSWGGLTICNDPKEAVKLIESKRYDCIVTDMKMPYISGNELIKKARNSKYNSESIIAAFTAFQEEDRFFDYGADTYIGKPILLDEIFKKLFYLIRVKEGKYYNS